MVLMHWPFRHRSGITWHSLMSGNTDTFRSEEVIRTHTLTQLAIISLSFFMTVHTVHSTFLFHLLPSQNVKLHNIYLVAIRKLNVINKWEIKCRGCVTWYYKWASHLGHQWCTRVQVGTTSCTAGCQAEGRAHTGYPSLDPCCSSTQIWSRWTCWWTTAGTSFVEPQCNRNPFDCLWENNESRCVELEIE